MTELPVVGDVIKSPPFSYRVIKIDGNRVTYEAQHLTWGYVSSRTVTLEEWQQVVTDSKKNPLCARCGNTGWIQRLPTIYEADSREEAALAWDMARYPCPECSK